MSAKIVIVDTKISLEIISKMAQNQFGDMIKGVVDVAREVMAFGGELHADSEAALLENGSIQSDLWGINLYPEESFPDFVEFDSLINIRPTQGNPSRNVEDPKVRETILKIVGKLVG